MIRFLLATCAILAAIGLVFWIIWAVAWIIMYIFPFTAAVTAGMLAVGAFMAWRQSRG